MTLRRWTIRSAGYSQEIDGPETGLEEVSVLEAAPVREAVLAARSELGIPQPLMPAPVAECYYRLTMLLADLEGNDDG